ncbi:DUF4396 domain-containing protein [Actinocatenispora thailandica]|uniref:DUF4396 domain-containing protein n=1 Tax=Actinocatenispora thailandica TaxID=227318 RepID=UPI0031D0B8E7
MPPPCRRSPPGSARPWSSAQNRTTVRVCPGAWCHGRPGRYRRSRTSGGSLLRSRRYALTVRGMVRAGLGLGAALRIALAADTVSIVVMEIIDNLTVLAIPGAMVAGLGSVLFWSSLLIALALALVAATPVNRWLISRGRGHAVAHRYHHGHGH